MENHTSLERNGGETEEIERREVRASSVGILQIPTVSRRATAGDWSGKIGETEAEVMVPLPEIEPP